MSPSSASHFDQIVVARVGFFKMRHGETRVASQCWPRNGGVFQVLPGTNRTGCIHSNRASRPGREVLGLRCVAVLLSIESHGNITTRVIVLLCRLGKSRRFCLGKTKGASHFRDMRESSTSSNDASQSAEPHEHKSTEHPLFPRPDTETGRNLRRFEPIQIRRWEQFIDEYGGECSYQFVTQTAKDHQFTPWSEKCFFAGPSR